MSNLAIEWKVVEYLTLYPAGRTQFDLLKYASGDNRNLFDQVQQVVEDMMREGRVVFNGLYALPPELERTHEEPQERPHPESHS